MLEKVRDAKGAANTQALLLAIRKLDGNRLKSTRAALAERLTRMTDETLRTMAQDKDAELRRGAVLAMAMKDDKNHLPDLIAALIDEDESVVRAARAGLKSLTNQDFGPAAGANLADRTAAAKAWFEWLRKQK
jgi:HEAT repeat protein